MHRGSRETVGRHAPGLTAGIDEGTSGSGPGLVAELRMLMAPTAEGDLDPRLETDASVDGVGSLVAFLDVEHRHPTLFTDLVGEHRLSLIHI